jgi:hypothetical protein
VIWRLVILCSATAAFAAATAATAYAQDATPPVLTLEECARVLPVDAAVPGANLTPGVDVRGNAVAGANLAPADPTPGAGQIDEITVPITVGVFERLGIPAPNGLGDLAANAGVLSIRLSDGQVTFNGQVLGATETSVMQTACDALIEGPGPVPAPAPVTVPAPAP